MLKKLMSFALVVYLIYPGGLQTAFAAGQQPKDDKDKSAAEKVKKGLDKFGVGEKARVEVKLKDDTKFKGYVYQAGEDSFVIVEKETERKITIAYEDVKKIKGRNLSTGQKIAIEVAVGAVALLFLFGIGIAVTAISLSH